MNINKVSRVKYWGGGSPPVPTPLCTIFCPLNIHHALSHDYILLCMPMQPFVFVLLIWVQRQPFLDCNVFLFVFTTVLSIVHQSWVVFKSLILVNPAWWWPWLHLHCIHEYILASKASRGGTTASRDTRVALPFHRQNAINNIHKSI